MFCQCCIYSPLPSLYDFDTWPIQILGSKICGSLLFEGLLQKEVKKAELSQDVGKIHCVPKETGDHNSLSMCVQVFQSSVAGHAGLEPA